MITPDIVIKHLIDNVLLPQKTELGITDVIELSNDSDSKSVQPPYLAIFEEFTDDFEHATAGGYPMLSPVDISIILSSSPRKTLQESTQQAYNIAAKTIKLVAKVFQLTNIDGENETVILRSRTIPIEIVVKSKQQTVLKLNFKYDMDMRP